MSCKNTNSKKINLSNPCNPCNACSSCNRCACECTCNLPDYCEEGCLTIAPSDCVKYIGPTTGNITSGMTLTTVIQTLVTGSVPSSPPSFASFIASTDLSDMSLEILSNRINDVNRDAIIRNDQLKEQLENTSTLETMNISNEDAIDLTFYDGVLTSKVDYKKLLNNLINYIKSGEEQTSIFGQLLAYINTPSNFINTPYQVITIPSITTVLMEWTKINEAVKYEVYKRQYGIGNFEKVAATPSLGLTISGLNPETLYEFYVISIDPTGNKSLPSKIVKTQTLSQTI